MIYPVGAILLIKNYQLRSQVKDKFFVVISHDCKNYHLLSMTTSRQYINDEHLRHGVISDRDVSMYCFFKHRVIGQNGFSFHKNTFISHRDSISEFSNDRLNNLNIEFKDILVYKELIDLIYSFYRYKGIKKKYKLHLEYVLHEIVK